MKHCSICERPHHGHGFCTRHLKRWQRNGDPLSGNTSPGEARSWLEAIPKIGEGCLFWPFGRNHQGYAILVMRDGISNRVSRRICERTHGPAPRKFDSAHSCGNGHLGCIAPWHLSWKTRTENMADTVVHGTRPQKLTREQVIEIRMISNNHSREELGRKFGVTRQAIGAIVQRKVWRHVP